MLGTSDAVSVDYRLVNRTGAREPTFGTRHQMIRTNATMLARFATSQRLGTETAFDTARPSSRSMGRLYAVFTS